MNDMPKPSARPVSLFDNMRLGLDGAIDLSLNSLRAYGERYRHWAITYSGGKDSSAVVTLVAWAIKTGQIPAPERLVILYADTRQEYPPLHQTAVKLLAHMEEDGFEPHIVQPELDRRFYVYILGYGVPPPHNQFRWCTGNIKIAPMEKALEEIRQKTGEKFLLINGVRLGESQVRDQRIALSCSKKGECGQGWFEVKPPAAAGDSLAPLLHWRVCNVYDWLYFNDKRHGYTEVAGIAAVYGEDDVRTGCIGCNLVDRDPALETIVAKPAWAHLAPLLELKAIFRDLQKPRNRVRKVEVEIQADGRYSSNGQRMGPLTMAARAWGLEKVLDIQTRSGVDLINATEEARIREMWELDMWPQKWTGNEIGAAVPVDLVKPIDGGKRIVIQPLLVR
jgi:DNA sulfur modification protein DndC